MDIQRMLLVVIFGMSAVFLWNEWQKLANPHPQVATAPASAPSIPAPGSDAAPSAPASGSVPAGSSVPASSATVPTAGGVPPVASATGTATGERITLESDVLRLVVNTVGGVIEEADLRTQQGTLDKSKPYQLLLNTKDRLHVAQAGLLGDGLPNHKTIYTAVPGPRAMDGADTLQFRLTTPITQGPAAGGKVDQVITLKKGSFVVDVAFDITNPGSAPLAATAYYHLLRDNKMPAGESSMVPTYTGPAIYDDVDKFKKVDWSDVEKKKVKYAAKSDNGWVAMVEHYFVAAIMPRDKVEREIYANKLEDGNFRAGVKVTLPPVAAGSTAHIDVPIYLGPQEQDTLGRTAEGLDRVVDYGIFHVLAAPLFLLLSWLHKLVGNWGWSIILLTILIKAVFYPLNAASARSMAKLKMVAP
ncbi:MAG: membrane protein insertase YidC, partial [Betaproteobacteria bacterium]